MCSCVGTKKTISWKSYPERQRDRESLRELDSKQQKQKVSAWSTTLTLLQSLHTAIYGHLTLPVFAPKNLLGLFDAVTVQLSWRFKSRAF